jgi:outer membrane protein insertion porin family
VFSVAGNSTFDRRDLPTDPAFGYYTQLTLEPGIARIDEVGGAISDQSLVGTHFFTKGSVEYRRYFTNQPKRTRQDFDAPRKVLAFRARAATISGTVPFFEQYFVGGSDTLRGYDEDRFWGKNMLITNLEYRYPIQRSFNAIGFVDYGGAWGGYPSVNAFTQSNGIDLHVGYGVGLSFRTPLGPIRIDIGFNEQGRSRTHFIIGTSF